jgi:hypothetical protein
MTSTEVKARAALLWSAAATAAGVIEAAEPGSCPNINLGVLPDDVMRELAALAGAAMNTHRYPDGVEIDGFYAEIGHVTVQGQAPARYPECPASSNDAAGSQA